MAGEIAESAVPPVLFVQGIDDLAADALNLDIAIGAGRVSGDKRKRSDEALTANVTLVDELKRSLCTSKPDLRIREGIAGYDLEKGDEVAWWLRQTWNDFDPSILDSWRSDEVNCLLLTLRTSGLRDTLFNTEKTARWLAEAIMDLSTFQELSAEEDSEMEKKSGESKSSQKSRKDEPEMATSELTPEVQEPEVLPVATQNVPAEAVAPPSSASGKEPGKTELDEDLVHEALEFINEKANETVYKGFIEIGDYILEKFFEGDVAQATSRNPNKPASYRALCKHPELVLTPEALSVMVRVAAQERFFLERELKTETLAYSHKAELAKLANDKKKLDLVRSLLAQPVAVRQLRKSIHEMRKRDRKDEGPSLLGLEKKIADPVWLFEDSARHALFNRGLDRRERLGKMSERRREALVPKVEEAVRKAEEWLRLYKALLQDLLDMSKKKDSSKG